MYDRQVSTIVFYDKNYRILLQNREDISKFGEEWGFFGGSIEDGETPSEALVREIREELEYEIRNFEFFKNYSAILPGNIVAIEYVHIARFPGFNVLNQKEGNSCKLFDIKEARKLKLLPAYYQMLDDLDEYFKASPNNNSTDD